jgi:uncharacterized 2Fe-2S/4Fe-4S cluster protein (DUF4445 family)
MHHVNVHLLPSDKLLRVEKGAALRDILFEHGVEFPCGGKGRCKGCRVRVIHGALPIHNEERQRLSPADLENGWRLACLGNAESDLTIEMAQWEAAILSDESQFEFTPREGSGVAIDLGTTTLAAQLLDLRSGNVLAVTTALNSQAQHGADIMSRIEFAVTSQGQGKLQSLIRDQIEQIVRKLLAEAGADSPPLKEIVLVGNTAMHHLFCGVDVEPLSHYPFEPAAPGLHVFGAADLGWSLRGSPSVRFLPCLGGFVGSDILAGILATGLHKSDRLTALMDLGTNGEIVVGTKDRMLCASTAAGPAFEGARISMGMRAATGAISEVSLSEGKLVCHTLGNAEARGICGSGLVDAVAAARELEWIRPNGRLAQGETLPLAGAVALTQWDIRELQMAKGAIAAGLRILLREWGATLEDLDILHLAGAFGNYINLASGRGIGLLNAPLEKIRPSGNTALLGAKMALFDSAEPDSVGLLARIRHVSLHEAEGFHDIYVDEMAFP